MLTAQIMRNFRIVRDWVDAGYFETDSLRQLRDDVVAAIRAGRLVAICGPVGSGKTMMMNRLQHDIAADKDIIVARSLSVDKPRVALPNLIMALFLDISGDPTLKAPTQPERRERLLQEMVRKARYDAKTHRRRHPPVLTTRDIAKRQEKRIEGAMNS